MVCFYSDFVVVEKEVMMLGWFMGYCDVSGGCFWWCMNERGKKIEIFMVGLNFFGL